jgi:hypothetical protein
MGRSGQGHRDRPEDAGGEAHLLAYLAPIGTRHETIQGCESADSQHQQIASFPGRNRQARQRGSPAQFIGALIAVQQKRFQTNSAMRLG